MLVRFLENSPRTGRMFETPNWSRKPMTTLFRIEGLEGTTLRSLARTLAIALVLAACNGDGGPMAPAGDIRGTYSGMWILRAVELGTGVSFEAACPGRVTINNQSTSTVSGTYVLSPETDCDPISGTFQGMRSDGGITIVLDPDPFDFEDEIEGCTILTSDDEFSGGVAGRNLSFDGSLTADCESDEGILRIRLTLVFEGTRPA